MENYLTKTSKKVKNTLIVLQNKEIRIIIIISSVPNTLFLKFPIPESKTEKQATPTIHDPKFRNRKKQEILIFKKKKKREEWIGVLLSNSEIRIFFFANFQIKTKYRKDFHKMGNFQFFGTEKQNHICNKKEKKVKPTHRFILAYTQPTQHKKCFLSP